MDIEGGVKEYLDSRNVEISFMLTVYTLPLTESDRHQVSESVSRRTAH